MKKFVRSLKATFKRTVPLLLAAASAVAASDGFRHFVEHHPAVAVYVPALVWILHAVGHQHAQDIS